MYAVERRHMSQPLDRLNIRARNDSLWPQTTMREARGLSVFMCKDRFLNCEDLLLSLLGRWAGGLLSLTPGLILDTENVK